MYKKSKDFRSSSFRGASYSDNSLSRSSSRGHFGNSNRFSQNSKGRSFSNNERFEGQYRNPNYQRGRSRGRLGNDVNIFIKKAAESSVTSDSFLHNSFTDFELNTKLRVNILNRGFSQPTPIQDQAIEPILNGRDIIGLASTGTGKTAAFLIPLINNISQNRNQKALVIAPTRELALQINEELKLFSSDMNIYSTLAIGGTNIARQIQGIRRNPHFVIGTPGRLKDLIQRKVLHLEDFSSFVLDEVDLMVDIGFINDIKYFISLLPQKRQSLFFSATISGKVSQLLQTFVHDPVTISLKKQDTSENVDQDIIRVISKDKKIEQLHDLLIQTGFDKVLVFGQTKHSVDRLDKELLRRGFKVGAIHGNKSQGQRKRALESFKQNQIQILLATDVASRGLDIDDVTHVINYELPETYEDYIHRIGRTGRANKKGVALTFVGG